MKRDEIIEFGYIGVLRSVYEIAENALFKAMTEEPLLINPFKIDETDPAAALGYHVYQSLIRKKEPEKKYMPFDLSDPEVRKSLRGKWIKDGAGEEACITGFKCDDEEDWIAEIPNGYIAATALASCWMFDDNSPCGKLVEEE